MSQLQSETCTLVLQNLRVGGECCVENAVLHVVLVLKEKNILDQRR